MTEIQNISEQARDKSCYDGVCIAGMMRELTELKQGLQHG